MMIQMNNKQRKILTAIFNKPQQKHLNGQT